MFNRWSIVPNEINSEGETIMREKLHIVSEEVFQISLCGYLLLLLLETIQEGFVSTFFNLYYLLAVIVISGIGMVLLEKESTHEAYKKKNDYTLYWGLLLSVITGCVVYYKTLAMGYLSIAIGVISFFIVLLFTYLIHTDESTS